MNGFDISKYETEEEKVDAFLQHLRNTKGFYSPKNKKSVINTERARLVASIYCMVKQMLSDIDGINIECSMYNDPDELDIAFIIIKGKDIQFKNSEWYQRIARYIEGIDIVLDRMGNVKILLGFSNMIKTISE